MTVPLHRLTLFAIITSIEEDLRDLVQHNILPGRVLVNVLGNEILEELRKRQSRDQVGFSIADETELIQYTNLSDVLEILVRFGKDLGSSFSTYFKKIITGLRSIVPIRNRVMHARPLHFDDYGRVADLAKHLARGRTDFWKCLNRTLAQISADGNVVSKLTIRSFDEPDTRILNNLPLPDFDDTGFIGRAAQTEETKQQILGSYPIVSIIAEGGYGKTALALKVCYDLLDSPDCPFEAIVWATAKASKLTPTEIVSIDNAITDSLGIFAAASSVIARNQDTDPLEDLIRNLAAFPVLLIIDNLETVLDENVDRLVRKIPRGSKILFTSRASMGAFHFPIKLLPFEPKEAHHYFRVTSRVWGLEDFSRLPGATIADYCKRLQHSPLFIKWFVQAVRTGQRPEAILANPKLILNYCLSNVYQHLTTHARQVLTALVCVGGFHSQATISFLTNLDSMTIQSALSILISSNLVVSRQARNLQDDETYTLSDLARMYLQNYATPSRDEQRVYLTRKQQLASVRDEIEGLLNQNPYDMDNISVQSEGDYVVARVLLEAIWNIKKRDYDAAEKRVQAALDLSPNFFEVKRVEAGVASLQGNFVRAEAAYGAAVSLAPNHAPLRLWYGDFLSKQLHESQEAIEQYEQGLRIEPGSPHILMALARTQIFRRHFGEAWANIQKVNEIQDLPPRLSRRLIDIRLQYYIRKADFEAAKDDMPSCLASIRQFRELYQSLDEDQVDRKAKAKITKVFAVLTELREFYGGTPLSKDIMEISEWFYSRFGEYLSVNRAVEAGKRDKDLMGVIHSCKGRYGFIDCYAQRYFFSRGEWNSPIPFSGWLVGQPVKFDQGHNESGICAINVRPEIESKAPSGRVLGYVQKVMGSYGFIVTPDGQQYYVNQSQFLNGRELTPDFIGASVEFSRREVSGKTPAADAVHLVEDPSGKSAM